MVQIDGKFIDGYSVSVTCYDITQTEVKALTLSCGNLSITGTAYPFFRGK
jgi:hypothetical protein